MSDMEPMGALADLDHHQRFTGQRDSQITGDFPAGKSAGRAVESDSLDRVSRPSRSHRKAGESLAMTEDFRSPLVPRQL